MIPLVFFWLPALACDNLFFAYFAYKVIPPQPRAAAVKAETAVRGMSEFSKCFWGFFFFFPPMCRFLQAKYFNARSRDPARTIPHQRRRLGGPDAAFK